MKPIGFKDQNCVFAKDQPEYLQLPAHRDTSGLVTSCWKLSATDRIRLLVFGKLWCSVLTFNAPLQPQKLQTTKPDMR